MRLSIERKPVRVNPDPKRVIARFFFNGNDRAKEVIQRVMDINRRRSFWHNFAHACRNIPNGIVILPVF
jgi:hypothetical protein